MENYVIYKGTEGLIHMLGGIVYCVDWCIENNHKLLIDCKCNDLFNLYFSEIFILKNFTFTENYDNIIETNKDKKKYIENIKLNKPKLLELATKTYELCDKIISKSLYKWKTNIKIYCGDGGNNRFKINKYIRIKNNIKLDIQNILSFLLSLIYKTSLDSKELGLPINSLLNVNKYISSNTFLINLYLLVFL